MREDYEVLYTDLSDRLNRLYTYIGSIPEDTKIGTFRVMKGQLMNLVKGFMSNGASVKVASRPKRYNELEKFALDVLKELEESHEWSSETLDVICTSAFKHKLAANTGEHGGFTRTRDGHKRRITVKERGV